MISIVTQTETTKHRLITQYVRESEITNISVFRSREEGVMIILLCGNGFQFKTADEHEAKRLYEKLTAKGGLLEGV